MVGVAVNVAVVLVLGIAGRALLIRVGALTIGSSKTAGTGTKVDKASGAGPGSGSSKTAVAANVERGFRFGFEFGRGLRTTGRRGGPARLVSWSCCVLG
jgi:hypothetical protein